MKNIQLAQKIKSDGAKTLLPMLNDQVQGVVSDKISSLLPNTKSSGSLANLSGGFVASQKGEVNLSNISGITTNVLPQYLKSPFDKN